MTLITQMTKQNVQVAKESSDKSQQITESSGLI